MDLGYTRDEIKSQFIYAKLMLLGSLSLTRMLVSNAGEVKKLRVVKGSEEHYIRPPRQYELPAYQPGMQVCQSNQKYLRPTRCCSYRTPEITAMAHHLGAYRLPPRQYAQNVFEFVKEKVLLEIMPIDDVTETLQRGTGTCFHLISLFIALCRAAGIPARYKMFAMNMIQAWRNNVIDVDPLVKKWYDAMGYFMLEGEGEVLLDGRWVVAHVGPTAERQASAGLPVTRLGEDALGLWFIAQPGTIMRLESMPLGMAGGSRMLKRIAPGSMERVNLGVIRQTEHGRAVIEAAGGVEAYDQAMRAKLGPELPQVDLDARPEIVFESQ